MARFGKGGGAPRGNKNAQKTGAFAQPHTGLSGVLGRAVGMRQPGTPADLKFMKSIQAKAQANKTFWKGPHYKMTPSESKRMDTVMKRSKPW